MNTAAVWWTVGLAGTGTLAIRISFVAFAHRATDLSPAVLRVLRMIPPAALAALAVPAIVLPPDGDGAVHPRLLAGLVAAAVAIRTKSVVWPLVVGLPLVAVLEAVAL